MSDRPSHRSRLPLPLDSLVGGLAAICALAAPPANVSPGELDRASPAAADCPTFSWAAAAGAGGCAHSVSPRGPASARERGRAGSP